MWARAIGVMGSLDCCVVLVSSASQGSLADYAVIRAGIDAIARWALIPSILLVLVSGLLALVATEAYKNSGWAWVKALLGLVMFEDTLLTIQSSTTAANKLTAAALASGVADPAAAQGLDRFIGLICRALPAPSCPNNASPP